MRFQPPRPKNDEERILPLVNVVFLLLIFFMLAGRLGAADPFGIKPPRSASEGLVESQEIQVQVGADGRLALDGELIDEAALKAAVAGRLASHGAGETPPPVRLMADGQAEAAAVVAVMELLHEAGVERLKLLTVSDTR